MHLKDIEAAVQRSTELSRASWACVAELLNTLSQPDHAITLRKQLEGGTELVSMAQRIEELEIENEQLRK